MILVIGRKQVHSTNYYGPFWSKRNLAAYFISDRIKIEKGTTDKRLVQSVLGQITTIFGANKVSLKSVIQKGVKQEENIDVTLVLITHSTTEGLIMDSIERLYDLKTVKSIDNIIRIEDFR